MGTGVGAGASAGSSVGLGCAVAVEISGAAGWVEVGAGVATPVASPCVQAIKSDAPMMNRKCLRDTLFI
ncbi:MAG: hypothetical protein IH872_12145 [Chloroflexi bacterium]|nr:hypothetical protein [Chloroflexota bacterium]